jgi:hypothetical protein
MSKLLRKCGIFPISVQKLENFHGKLRYQHKELLKWKEGVHQARLISFS